MVAVVQLVEHLVVVQDVAGSSPVSHPVCAVGRSLRLGFAISSHPALTPLKSQESVHPKRGDCHTPPKARGLGEVELNR